MWRNACLPLKGAAERQSWMDIVLRCVLIAAAILIAHPARACGPDTDCAVGERTYRIAAPDEARGAFVFLHGWRSTGAALMRNTALRDALAREGYALVAPQSVGEQWSLPNMPGGQRFDELPFLSALRQDLIDRHGIPPDSIVLGGFSAGAMATWDVACRQSELFDGYVAISGTYWKGPPQTCTSPGPNLLHIHGMSDRVVPYRGRPIGDTVQGDVGEALTDMRRTHNYGDARSFKGDRFGCTAQRSPQNRLLMECRHPGGHEMPAEFAAFGLQQLRERTGLE